MSIRFDERDLAAGWVIVIWEDGVPMGRITRYGSDEFGFYRQQGQVNPSCVVSNLEALKLDIVAHPRRYAGRAATGVSCECSDTVDSCGSSERPDPKHPCSTLGVPMTAEEALVTTSAA